MGFVDQYYCWGAFRIEGHLNVFAGGPFKLVGKN